MVDLNQCICSASWLILNDFFPGYRGSNLKYGFHFDTIQLARSLNLIADVSLKHFFQLLQSNISSNVSLKGYCNNLNESVYRALRGSFSEYRCMMVDIEDHNTVVFDNNNVLIDYRTLMSGCYQCPRVLIFKHDLF